MNNARPILDVPEVDNDEEMEDDDDNEKENDVLRVVFSTNHYYFSYLFVFEVFPA